MTEQDLKQIGQLLQAQLEPLRAEMREQIGGLRSEMREKMETMQDHLEEEIRHTRMLVEKQGHDIRVIAEQYGDISQKLERLDEIDDLRDRVRTLETVVRNHSARLQELDKAE